MKVKKHEIKETAEGKGLLVEVIFESGGEEYVNIDSFDKINQGLAFIRGGSTYESLVEDPDMDGLYEMLERLYEDILKPYGGISE